MSPAVSAACAGAPGQVCQEHQGGSGRVGYGRLAAIERPLDDLTAAAARAAQFSLPGKNVATVDVTVAVGRLTELRTQRDERISAYKGRAVTDRTTHDLVVRAVDSRVIPVTQCSVVLQEWWEPSHPEFGENGRSIWALFNAFTESFKSLSLEMLPRRSQALHGLMDGVCQMDP